MNRVSEHQSHPNQRCEILSVHVKSNGVCVYSQETVLVNIVTCMYRTWSSSVERNDAFSTETVNGNLGCFSAQISDSFIYIIKKKSVQNINRLLFEV